MSPGVQVLIGIGSLIVALLPAAVPQLFDAGARFRARLFRQDEDDALRTNRRLRLVIAAVFAVFGILFIVSGIART